MLIDSTPIIGAPNDVGIVYVEENLVPYIESLVGNKVPDVSVQMLQFGRNRLPWMPASRKEMEEGQTNVYKGFLL